MSSSASTHLFLKYMSYLTLFLLRTSQTIIACHVHVFCALLVSDFYFTFEDVCLCINDNMCVFCALVPSVLLFLFYQKKNVKTRFFKEGS
jgi:hypothetical protein